MPKNVPSSSNLCPEAQEFLDNLTSLLKVQEISTSLDESALRLIGNTYHTYITATKFLLENPKNYLIESPRGETKAHPFVKIANDSQIQLDKLMDKFGLNPKSRKEIHKPKEKANEQSPLDKFLISSKLKHNGKVRDQVKN